MVHNDPADADEPGASAATLLADNLITLTGTVTDFDGDTASETVNIGSNLQFEDDGPSIFDPAAAALANQAGTTVTRALDIDSNIINNFGADGAGLITFANIVSGQDTTLTSNDVMIELFLSNNGQTLQGRTGSTDGTNGTLIYTVQLNQAAGTYTVTIAQPIDNGSGLEFADLTSGAAGNVNYRGIGANDPVTPVDILLSATSSGGAVTSVNTNDSAIGAANQSMDPGESVRIDFVNNLTSGAATPTGFAYAGHAGTNSFVQDIPQVGGGQTNTVSFKVFALNTTLTQAGVPDSNPTGGFADASTVTITSVTVTDYLTLASTSLDISGLANGDTTAVAYGISVTRNADGSISFSGVQEGDSYGIGTGANDFNAVVVQDTSGSFDLGIFAIGSVATGDPVSFGFDLKLTDADGDSITVVDAIQITANPVVTPVALDTNHDGVISYLAVDAGVAYDYDGDGQAEGTAWVGSGDSLLIRDADGNGTVSNASEFVFGGNGQTDLEALHAQYGEQLDASDADFVQFMVWNDANSDGIADAGEVQSLVDADIVSIDLTSNGVTSSAAGGDVAVSGEGQFTYDNDNGGHSTGLLADVAFRIVDREQDQRYGSTASTTAVVTGAVAAMGLMASQAAADGGDQSSNLAAASGLGMLDTRPVVNEGGSNDVDASRFLFANESRVAADANDMGETGNALRTQPVDAKVLAEPADALSDAADLLAPTDAPVHAQIASPVAPMIVMPTAESLAAFDNGGVESGGQKAITVEKVVADALAGGAGGGGIDALLASLPGHVNGGNAALEALATHEGEGVPGWDMGAAGTLSASQHTNIAADMAAFHHDAVQPAING